MIRRYIIFPLLLVVAVVIATMLHWSGLTATPLPPERYDEQDRSAIIKFSHKSHAVEGVNDCSVCHTEATTSTRASDNLLATKQSCTTCHDVEDTEQCLKCHYENGEKVKFENPGRDIIFPHEKHIAAGMECVTCHQGIDKADFAGRANMPGMGTCNTCHNNSKVSNTCESCHTNFASLLPMNHQRSDFLHNHKDEVRLGSMDISCQTCHAETFCQDCHQGGGLKQFGKRDLMADPGSKRSTKDSHKQTVLQNVHSLNYRFTHGVDAKSKLMDCASCHEAQTFCVECHQAGGNITQLKFKPTSHSVAGFTTLGRGSGGGLHAQEARRDIENCMSCHDVQGADPSCMTCHLESGQVR